MTACEIIEQVYNSAKGPSARMKAFREGIAFTLAQLGVDHKVSNFLGHLTIQGGVWYNTKLN